MQHEVARWPDAGNSDIKQKAARRRLLNSILMMDQTNLNAGFDLRRGARDRSGPDTSAIARARPVCAGAYPLSRGKALLPAEIFARPESHIEQVFAKLKHLLRKAAARTIEAVWAAIGEALNAFKPKECANYFENSGYAST